MLFEGGREALFVIICLCIDKCPIFEYNKQILITHQHIMFH